MAMLPDYHGNDQCQNQNKMVQHEVLSSLLLVNHKMQRIFIHFLEAKDLNIKSKVSIITDTL